MTQKRLKGRFLIKAKTAQEFAAENPTLLNNELVIEKDTGKKKLGDGTTKYNNLNYLESVDWNEISNKPAEFPAKEHTHLYAGSSAAGGAATKAIADGDGNTITSTYAKTTAIPTKVSQLTNDKGYLTNHQDISGKADKATTLAGYGITDANITNGKITLGNNSITPITQHQSLTGYAKTTDIPTRVSQLTNDKGYLTSHQSLDNYYIKSEVDSKISTIPKFAIKVVDSLPITGGDSSTVYLVKSGNDSQNLYTEYIQVGTTWERLGTQDVNLTDYAKKTEIPTKMSQLTNDSGYLTQHQSLTGYVKNTDLATVATSGSYTDLKDKPTIPDVSNKADKATTLAGYGITDAKIANGTITLGSSSITPLTSHQSLSAYATTSAMNTALAGKANTATTLAGYGITDAKISNGTITLGSSTITPLTSHQSLSNYVTLDGTQTISGDKTFSGLCGFTGQQLLLTANTVLTWYNGSPNRIAGTLSNGVFSGKAASADKLTTDAGNEKIPVYFKDGVPVACTTANSMPVNRDSISTADFGYEIINDEIFLLKSISDGAEIATLNANVSWENIQNKPEMLQAIYPEYTTGLYKFSTNEYGQITGATKATKSDIVDLGITYAASSTAGGAATKSNIGTSSSNTSMYIPFVAGTGSQELKSSTSLKFNPYSGSLSATKVTTAVYNDYAEFFPRGEKTEPGDIIALDMDSENEQYIKATANSIVAGVHSNEYAHIIGGEEAPEGEDHTEYNIKKYIPISLAGRVHVKVIGKVKRGDYIVASDIAGVGIATDKPENGRAIVGYAVESNDVEDIKMIKVRVKGA